MDEAIYLKNKDGNEIGPFKDQDAKEEYIKEQKQNGYQGEFEEIIKENKKEEKMSKDNLTENCYKVYNTTFYRFCQYDFLKIVLLQYKLNRAMVRTKYLLMN